MFAPSVSSGYGHSSGQAGTGIQRVKSIGAERGLLPLIIFTHERLSNNGLQPHVGAGMLLHRLASAGHKAWERDTHTQGPGGAGDNGEGERSGEREGGGEERIHSEHISAKQHVYCPIPPYFPAVVIGVGGSLGHWPQGLGGLGGEMTATPPQFLLLCALGNWKPLLPAESQPGLFS